MPWEKMVDLELDDEDKMDAVMPISMPSRPDFPYGTRISLTKRELDKLGLPLPERGDMIDFRAIGTVTSVSSSDTEYGGEGCCVEIQIEKMSVED